jgi:spore coat protein U-like protein
MKIRLAPALVLTVAALALGSEASADTVQSAMPVTASVAAVCQVQNVLNTTMGYDPVVNRTTAARQETTFDVVCTKGATYQVSLDQGKKPDAASTCATPVRQMENATQPGVYLPYNVYSDSAYTKIWGCDASNLASFTALSGLSPTSVHYYVSAEEGQDVPAGAYTDQMVITVTF